MIASAGTPSSVAPYNPFGDQCRPVRKSGTRAFPAVSIRWSSPKRLTQPMFNTRVSALWSQPVARGIGKGRSKRVMRAPIVALGAAVALLVAGLILAVANERAYQSQKVDEVTVEARLLSILVSSALDFNDRGAAREYLEALRANPEAQAGAIYDAQDKLLPATDASRCRRCRRPRRGPALTSTPTA